MTTNFPYTSFKARSWQGMAVRLEDTSSLIAAEQSMQGMLERINKRKENRLKEAIEKTEKQAIKKPPRFLGAASKVEVR